MILHVTRPVAAEAWEHRLRATGFGRVAVVTGNSAGADRREVLDGLRSGRGSTSRYDVVVATSAFGLGIDNDQVRTIIHACLPETLDRWYQEVGRSGRDGHTSVAVLLPAYGDAEEAAGLGITMLKPETALSRWESLWRDRVVRAERNYVDVHHTPTGVDAGSYNRRWNAQVLRGLEELGQIRRRQVSLNEAAELELPVGTLDRPHEWELVELVALDLQNAGFFNDVWEPWRGRLLRESRQALDQMKDVLEPDASVCELLAAAYTANPAFRQRHPRPGAWMRQVPWLPRARRPAARRSTSKRDVYVGSRRSSEPNVGRPFRCSTDREAPRDPLQFRTCDGRQGPVGRAWLRRHPNVRRCRAVAASVRLVVHRSRRYKRRRHASASGLDRSAGGHTP